MDVNFEHWNGITVAQALARCRTPYEEVELIDEPPGRLHILAFTCHGANPPAPVRVSLQPDPRLFSQARDWSRDLVEAQKVEAVLPASQELP